jgi:pimeloyl-ACP methyl ester carboxylesterase
MSDTDFESRRLRYFEACGTRMAARRVSDREGRTLYGMESRGDGPPVIVIHGGGSDASLWAPLMPLLSRERRWIVVDRPGHGLSYKLDYGRVDYRRAASQSLRDLLDGLGLERASFLASSMGGYFSLCFALDFPRRVDKLILMGAPAGVDRWLPPMIRLLGLRGVNRLLFAMMAKATVNVQRERLFRALLVAHPEGVPDELIALSLAAARLPGASRAMRTMFESVATPAGFRRRSYIRDEVSRLAVPTTFVWGDRDAFAPPTSGAELVRRMPQAQLVCVEGAGHLPWLDQPQPCARAVEGALTAAPAATATARATLPTPRPGSREPPPRSWP